MTDSNNKNLTIMHNTNNNSNYNANHIKTNVNNHTNNKNVNNNDQNTIIIFNNIKSIILRMIIP
jgi:hypothetical protein